jgi:putative ABC transport system substrate-binding protein
VATLNAEMVPQRVELAHELIPTATAIGLLVNPGARNVETLTSVTKAAAAALGLRLHVLRASNEQEIEDAFTTFVQLRAGVLVIGPDAYLISQSIQLARLTIRQSVPVIFEFREFAMAGGLISYGGSNTDEYRLAGVYTGRILKGEKPADLPVQQSTKVELIVNLKTAKALGITVPLSLLGRADELIE